MRELGVMDEDFLHVLGVDCGSVSEGEGILREMGVFY